MATIKPKYKPKPDARGRKQLRGWQIEAFSKGDKPGTFFYSANDYERDDVEKRRLILNSLERVRSKRGALAEIGDELSDELRKTPDLLAQLIGKGYIDAAEEMTLGELWNRRLNTLRKDDYKPTTMGNNKRAKAHFFEFFEESEPVNTLTRERAQAFSDWAKKQETPQGGRYSEATRAGWLRDINALLNWAVQNGLARENPFKGVKRGTFTNPARDVTLETLEKILDACPSAEWRVLFLFARRLGLRVPTETSAARWKDVDFNESSILIHCKKTEHIKGKESRLVPLFPDVKAELLKLKQEQEERGERSPYIFPSARGLETNLRTQARRIIYRAGVEQWEKTFQNLRSSAATDIGDKFGSLAESAWVGHSPETAKKHYLQITPERFQAGTQWDPRAAERSN